MGTQGDKTDAPTHGERGPVYVEQEQKQGGGLLKGKWALVTGTSRGIGRAIAEAFAAESASLIITSEPQAKEDLEHVADVCKENGAADVKVVYADLTDPQETKKLGEEALKLSGGCVNVLVNNAGVYYPMSFDEGPNKGQGPLDGNPDDWDKQTHINLMAPMRLTRMLLNPMKDSGEGHVVNIASIEALYPYPSAPAYSATKWGLRGWSKALFAALKSDNIKVLTVNPAQVNTPMTRSRPDAEYLPDMMIQPREIAEAIVMTFRLNPNAFLEEITLQTAEPPKKPKE